MLRVVTPSRSASSGPVQTGRCCSSPSRWSTRWVVSAMPASLPAVADRSCPVCPRGWGHRPKGTAMALHVPPVADETDAIHAFLAQAQDAFRALLHGLTPRQASIAPSASSLSLGGLVKHVTAVQRSWLASAEAAPDLAPESGGADDYFEGFTFRETDSLEDLLATYDEVCPSVLD